MLKGQMPAQEDRPSQPERQDDRQARQGAIVSAITASLRPGICFRGGGVADADGELSAEETRASEGFHPVRKAEFRAGRLYARQALDALGFPVASLPIGPGRAPLWPDGAAGSLSHSHGFCGAAVARRGAIRSIGFDIDTDADLPARLVPRICTPLEWARIERAAQDRRLALAKQLFVVKESLYKAYWPLTGSYLGFLDVEVVLDQPAQTFSATIGCSTRPAIDGLTGWIGAASGYVFAFCTAGPSAVL